MTQPQTLSLVCLLSAAALLTTLGGCVSHGPDPSQPNSPPPGLRGLLPFGTAQVYAVPANPPPSAGVLCRLSTGGRCSEIFPRPARACHLASERCPPDAKLERIDTRPLEPGR